LLALLSARNAQPGTWRAQLLIVGLRGRLWDSSIAFEAAFFVAKTGISQGFSNFNSLRPNCRF
jgi:hypothetical protein